MYLSPYGKRAKQIISDWSEELATKLGRSAQELETRGLNASDFPISSCVKLLFPDGSKVHSQHAFYVTSELRSAIAVFTEHCGYHIFPLIGTKGLSGCKLNP